MMLCLFLLSKNDFLLSKNDLDMQMETIIKEVLAVTTNWKTIAKEIGISRSEQELMEKAFHL